MTPGRRSGPPEKDRTEALRALSQLGPFTLRDARRVGLNQQAVMKLHRKGVLIRLGCGVYKVSVDIHPSESTP